ncbi:response regulator transcription factor [Mangrovicoccus ximenensis]|uniref:response regulator transcription factor n=1 Tax=Mangrovicoccus ximenensis TaxID=1911570 RepID=UPI001F025463|nr:response regulator [Mangrovicoccus ximenensis]
MRILLVEDHAELAATITQRLRAEGHAVDLEADGAAAERLLRHSQFDLVILDVNLPGRSGFDVLSELRLRGDETPVLILTARSRIEDRVTGLDAGADDFMVKPFDLRELAARCRMLGRRESGRGHGNDAIMAGAGPFPVQAIAAVTRSMAGPQTPAAAARFPGQLADMVGPVRDRIPAAGSTAPLQRPRRSPPCGHPAR